MLEALPPKSHWKQESAYMAEAQAQAEEFKALVREKWQDSKASAKGSADILDGPLELLNIPDEQVFLTEGFDYIITSPVGAFERPDLEWVMTATPEDEDVANDLKEKLNG